MQYREAVDWLFGVARFGMKLGLDNTRALLLHLDLPQPGLRLIHVAGTNGKGSTCAFAHACLHAAGHRAGLFTSPHLIDFRERIRVGHDLISEEDTARLLSELRPIAESMDPHPSFFEIAFALALLHFRESKADCAVIETGLGGRLDATNALTPDVSAITGIGIDHTRWLGASLAEIAAEKAGIIKPGIPAVSAPQDPSALAVLQNRAAELDSAFTVIDPATYPVATSLGLRGEHQRENAALALAALRAGNFPVAPAALALGLRSTCWPARFQSVAIPAHPSPAIVDGAHNAHAARALAATWHAYFPGQKATVIYSAADGKDVPAFIAETLPITARLILTSSTSSRARAPQDLLEEIRSAFPAFPPAITLAPDPASALAAAGLTPQPILITGSLFLAGDILAHLKNAPCPDPSESL